MSPRIRVYLACSLDGYIAGLNHDISWLPTDDPGETTALTFGVFMEGIGAMLMGRSTFDTVAGLGWAYGDIPVLVATRRPLETSVKTVSSAAGDIDTLLDRACAAAGSRDVYLDGGDIVRQALVADRVDELTLTTVPIVLGDGVPLFTPGLPRRDFQVVGQHRYGSMSQVTVARKR